MSEQNPLENDDTNSMAPPPTPTKPKFFQLPSLPKKTPPMTPPRSLSPLPPQRNQNGVNSPVPPPKRSSSLKKIPVTSLKKNPSFQGPKLAKFSPNPPPRPPPPSQKPNSSAESKMETVDNTQSSDSENLENVDLSSLLSNLENDLSSLNEIDVDNDVELVDNIQTDDINVEHCDNNQTNDVNVEQCDDNQTNDVNVEHCDDNQTNDVNVEHADNDQNDDDPPPPPPSGDSDFSFDSYKSPGEMGEETPTPRFTNLFSEDIEKQDKEIISEDTRESENTSEFSEESEFSENDTPPQNIEPLPANLHPKGSPPALPFGVVNPNNSTQKTGISTEDNENKKKKNKFTQFKGFFKNKKKKDEDDKKIKAKIKEEEHLVSAIADRLDRYFKLIDLLNAEDNNLLYLISNLITRGDVDKQSRAWVRIFGPKGCLLSLLIKIIKSEVIRTDHEGTLFRNNTFPVGLLSQYAHTTGRQYLKSILVDNIIEVIEGDKRFEVNPDGDGNGLTPDEIDQNTMNLLTSCEKIFNSIIGSKLLIPPEIRRICKELRDRVKEKFPGAVHTSVGGFLFLRFITPSIVSPEGFQLLTADISIEKRRPLILISKTLQQIANDMYFSEDYLMSINSFITENVPILHTFFDEVCDVDDNVTPNPFPEIVLDEENLKARDDALIRLHQFIIKVLPELKVAIQAEPSSNLQYNPIVELEKILESLGEPPDPKILKQPLIIKKKDKKK